MRAVVVGIGLVALAFLLVEPHFEGRNAHATLFEIYFKDPFLAFAYIGSIPFFVALYQAYIALGLVQKGELLSPAVVKALRTIRDCALAVIGFALIGEIIIVLSESDDRAGGVVMGLLVICGAIAAAIAASKLERIVRKSLV